jgi:hypothetical protein
VQQGGSSIVVASVNPDSPPHGDDSMDEAVVQRVLSGETRAFELLVTRHQERVFPPREPAFLLDYVGLVEHGGRPGADEDFELLESATPDRPIDQPQGLNFSPLPETHDPLERHTKVVRNYLKVVRLADLEHELAERSLLVRRRRGEHEGPCSNCGAPDRTRSTWGCGFRRAGVDRRSWREGPPAGKFRRGTDGRGHRGSDGYARGLRAVGTSNRAARRHRVLGMRDGPE